MVIISVCTGCGSFNAGNVRALVRSVRAHSWIAAIKFAMLRCGPWTLNLNRMTFIFIFSLHAWAPCLFCPLRELALLAVLRDGHDLLMLHSELQGHII